MALNMSDVDVLENGNRFVDFGGIVRDGEGAFRVETNLNSYRTNIVSL